MKRANILLVLLVFMAALAAGCSDVNRNIKKLKAEDCQKDRQCSKAMASLMSVPGIDKKLQKPLMNQKLDPKIRKNIATILGMNADSHSNEKVLPILEKALGREKDSGVRVVIVQAISKTPGKNSIPVLQAALSDDDHAVAGEAARILNSKAVEKMAEAEDYDMDAGGFTYRESIYNEALEYNPCDLNLVEKFADLYDAYSETLEGAESDKYAAKGEELKKICGAFVSNMYIAAPFDGNFKKTHIKIAGLNPSEDDPTAGIDENKYADASWDVIPENFRDKLVIHLNKIIEDEWALDVPDKFSLYGAFTVTSKSDQDVLFRVGTDVKFALWLNGKDIYSEDREHKLDEEKLVKAALKKGKNRVVIKLTGGLSLMRMRMRISTRDNKMPAGISYGLN